MTLNILINKRLRDAVNLLIYGGAFIGLCAACITALSFELTGRAGSHLDYLNFIGAATAALYCGHRVIGLRKLQHIQTSERYTVIRKYKDHIWVYCVIWVLLTAWFFIPIASIDLILWLIPGGGIALSYVVPAFPGGRRLRDLGWWKIIMIGWSWGWLTAFIPLYFFAEASLQLSVIHGLERMLFIILITIPFEIRDLEVDSSMGLSTLPRMAGRKRTMMIALLLIFFIVIFSGAAAFHYLNESYLVAMSVVSLATIPVIVYSYRIQDDYFFGGLTDGLMILALILFQAFQTIL